MGRKKTLTDEEPVGGSKWTVIPLLELGVCGAGSRRWIGRQSICKKMLPRGSFHWASGWSYGWHGSCRRDSGRMSHMFNKDHRTNNKFIQLQAVGWKFCWRLSFCYGKWTKTAYDPFRWNDATSDQNGKPHLLIVHIHKLWKGTWCYVNPLDSSYSSCSPKVERVYAISHKNSTHGTFVWKNSFPFHNQTEFFFKCVDWTHCPVLLSFAGRTKTQILSLFH